MLRLGVLVSGSGTNLEAIVRACEAGEVPARVAVVVSNSAGAYALKRAADHGIEGVFVDLREFASRDAYDRALVELLEERGVELVALAGYMLLAGPALVGAFRGRILNIHPALLPSFPGTHGVADALAYGVKVSGVTVHFVDEGLDTGPVILQEAVEVREDDDESSLHQRIHEAEYRLYPLAIRYFAEGRLSIEGRRVRIDPPPEY